MAPIGVDVPDDVLDMSGALDEDRRSVVDALAVVVELLMHSRLIILLLLLFEFKSFEPFEEPFSEMAPLDADDC